MTKKMLIDAAHPEEVRVALLDNGKVEDFDFESATRKPLRGNIYLARVTRVEPSLQAAFVEYGGNRHGFLAFSEIHPDYYQIPVSDRRALQAAEQEVADLAAQLELSQRGDDDHFDDDEDHDDDHDTSDDKPRASGRRSKSRNNDAQDNAPDGADESDGDDDSRAASAGDSSFDDSDDEASSDPVDEIEGDPADIEDEDEEDEEEEDGEEDDDNDAPTSKADSDNEENEHESTDASAEDNLDQDSDAEDEQDDDALAKAAASDDSAADEDGEDDEEGLAPSRKQPSGKEREALFERYKEAKRKSDNLLRNYKIQEVIKRRQILLIQVVKEERGTKGAALTTYMSLAGRYCVLMPNTARGGGISRKIPHSTDRKRLRRVVDSLDVPQGMGLIIRTAGAKRTKVEIKRDYDYLLRLWENIRSLTLKSIAPCLIYEEASLIKRAIRDLYDKDIGEVQVEGENGYREAKDFMKMLMPSHAKFVQPYKGDTPIFLKHGVEAQLDGMYQPTVRLKSGGYIVIHQTEALVAIDVNSGRSTRERNIEQTALKTNIEAAYEAARQFRLRDLAGLIVLDFIDMDEMKNNRKVEKALKDALKNDRARIQIGRISNFGLLEMSRQRRRSGIVDGTTQACPTCSGAGVIRSAEMAALRILRAVEGEAVSGKAGVLSVHASLDVTVYVLNHHRDWLKRIEDAHGVTIHLIPDTDRAGDDFSLEKTGVPRERPDAAQFIRADQTEMIELDETAEPAAAADEPGDEDRDASERDGGDRDGDRKKRRRRRRRKDGPREQSSEGSQGAADASSDDENAEADGGEEKTEQAASRDARDGEASEEEQARRRRRRGRRGGRRNRRNRSDGPDDQEASEAQDASGAIDQSDKDSGDAREAKPNADAPSPQADIAQEAPPLAGNGHETRKSEAVDIAPPPIISSTDDAGANETPPDLADAPQPVVEKPRKKGWWNRGSSA